MIGTIDCPRRTTAFTLVEVLVVIAIVAMLAAILLPSLGRARKKAHATECVNNLRQLGYAVHMYWDDNEGALGALSGIFPTWTSDPTNRAWTQLLYPYVKTTKSYLDPDWPTWMPELPVSYYLNLLPAYVAAGSPGSGRYAVQIRRISLPSNFILMSEDLWVSPIQEIDPTNERSDRTGFSGTATNYPPPHAGLANFLFADAHVAAFNHFDPGQMTYWYDGMANWQTNHP
jgi:prepilin-type N-terminal cleavage/methylation domain-containing protein/prepilin-type processing-associated H-X9-DG protein